MNSYKSYMVSACWLLLLLGGVGAQTPATEPGDVRPAPTPEKTAQPKPSPELIAEFGVDYEALSNDRPDWQTYFLRLNRKFSSGQMLYGEATIVHRFGQTDPSLMIGWYQPLNQTRTWTTNLEISGSP